MDKRSDGLCYTDLQRLSVNKEQFSSRHTNLKYHGDNHTWGTKRAIWKTVTDCTASADTKDVKYPVNICKVSILKHVRKVVCVRASVKYTHNLTNKCTYVRIISSQNFS
jgi:hypothetical protein